MNDLNLEAKLRAANPVSRDLVDVMALEAGEEEMLDAIAAELEPERRERVPSLVRRPSRPFFGGFQLHLRPLALAATTACAAVAFFVLFSTGGGPAGQPTSATADRLADVSPHLLIVGKDWRIESASETHSREGGISFFRGTRAESAALNAQVIPYVLRSTEIQWRTISAVQRERQLSEIEGASLVGTAPVPGARARIYERPGSTKYSEFTAVWNDEGRALQFRSTSTDLDSFLKRLALLRLVNEDRWTDAIDGEVIENRGGVVVLPSE